MLVCVSYIAQEIPIDESFSLEVSTPANASLTSVHAIITLSPIFLSVCIESGVPSSATALGIDQ